MFWEGNYTCVDTSTMRRREALILMTDENPPQLHPRITGCPHSATLWQNKLPNGGCFDLTHAGEKKSLG